MRPTPKVLAVAGLALCVVVDCQHDRLYQYVAPWHRNADVFGPRAEMPHFPKRRHELRWICFRVALEVLASTRRGVLEKLRENFAPISGFAGLTAVLGSTVFLYGYLSIFDWRLIWVIEYSD